MKIYKLMKLSNAISYSFHKLFSKQPVSKSLIKRWETELNKEVNRMAKALKRAKFKVEFQDEVTLGEGVGYEEAKQVILDALMEEGYGEVKIKVEFEDNSEEEFEFGQAALEDDDDEEDDEEEDDEEEEEEDEEEDDEEEDDDDDDDEDEEAAQNELTERRRLKREMLDRLFNQTFNQLK